MFKHKSVMFIYYFIYVSISFFFSPFLISEKGFSPEQMGFLTTYGLICLLVSFFTFGMISDWISSNKKIIITNLFISFLIFIGLIIAEQKIILIILYILSYASFIMLTSQIDALVIRDIPVEKYSRVRSFGSFGAATSYFINSYALTDISYNIILIFNSFLIIALLILISTIKEHEYQNNSIKEYFSGIKMLKRHPEVLLIMIITFLTYGTLSADDAYQFIYNTQVVKISGQIIGIVGFISIILEGSFMQLFDRFFERLGIIKMLNIAIMTLLVIYITRFTLYTNPFIINLGSIMMGVFIGFFVPSAIYLINKNIDSSIRGTILSLYQIMIKLGGVILGFITAVFYSNTHSLQNIYLLHSLIIATSFIVIYLLSKQLKK